MQRIRKGDEVIVITGRDKGKHRYHRPRQGQARYRALPSRRSSRDGRRHQCCQEAYSPEPDDGCYWRYRQQGYADRSIERHARESGHR